MSMTKHSQVIQNYHNTGFSGKGNARGQYKVTREENNLKNKKRETVSLNPVLYFYFILFFCPPYSSLGSSLSILEPYSELDSPAI